MIKFKPGGGNLPEKYNSLNGEYVGNSKKLADDDFVNLVLNKICNVNTGVPIVFPKQNYHSKNYADLYIKYCVVDFKHTIERSKIENYLLIQRKSNDKCIFLESLGYSKYRPEKLLLDIYNNTDFSFRKLSKFINYSFTLKTKTILNDSIKDRKIEVTSVWQIRPNNELKFVTLIPRRLEEC